MPRADLVYRRAATSSISGPHHQVELSRELWQIVLDDLDDRHQQDLTEPDRLCVVLRHIAASQRRRSGNSQALQSIVCWARKEQSVHASNGKDTYLLCNEALPSAYPDILGRGNRFVNIHQTSPVLLSQVVLSASSASVYASATSNTQCIQDWLCENQRILRQGETYRIPHHAHAGLANGYKEAHHISLKVLMCQPALQGYADEAKTEFVLIQSANDEVVHDAMDPATQVSHLDIDEDFLAASFLGELSAVSAGRSLTNGFGSPGVHTPSAASDMLDASYVSNIDAGKRTVPISAWRYQPFGDELLPAPQTGSDPEARAFANAATLVQLGVFSGDKILLGNPDGSQVRPAQIFALDIAQSKSILVSPCMLHNLGNPSAATWVRHRRPTDLPVAQSVTIARIASEYSMNKRYQSMVLKGLKEYFQQCQRVVQQGDILAIPIDTAQTRFQSEQQEVTEESAEEFMNPPFVQSRATAVAWFQIAQIDGSSNDTIESGGSHPTHRIDAHSTRMVQTGVVNATVPDALAYFGITRASDTSDLTAKVTEYLQSALRAASSSLQLDTTALITGARGSGKATLAHSAVVAAGMHAMELDCYDIVGETDAKTEGNLSVRMERAAACTPCCLILRHIEGLARKSQTVETGQEPAVSNILQESLAAGRKLAVTTGFPLVIIATCTDIDKVPTSITKLFQDTFEIAAPDEKERQAILEAALNGHTVAPDVSLQQLAVQTAALVAADLVNLCNQAVTRCSARLTKNKSSRSAVADAGIVLSAADFAQALDKARSAYSESIGAPKIPNVTWDDVGGLASVKSEILDTIQLPLERPELFADGLKKRSGVLLYGPPGTGKTLLAKAVATSCSLNFFSVKGPELLNMYIGESEANVRRVFQRARDAKPCVIFFDELDSVAPKRGNQGDSGGVMDRIVSQLLAELDGMSEGAGGADVFVIGATNRPDLLDPALLRPGRFDRMLYLGVSDTQDAQRKIIEALTRKFKLDPDVDLGQIAQLCPFNYTGADFYALCSDALLKAMSRKAEDVDRRISELNQLSQYSRTPLTPQYYLAEMAKPEEIQVLVSQADFQQALAELVPSVSAAEMQHYKEVQRMFSRPIANGDVKGKGRAV